jgi:dipeptidyl aminopeptidase/acylaminoacyl peptidase
MDPALERLEGPTAELLLDVRTPAELTFSPDEARIAFALHATVADVGSFVPSDLYVVDVEGDEPPQRLTSGAWSDRTPAWSHDGSRLAFLSDRVTPGHQLPYTMPVAGGAGARARRDPADAGVVRPAPASRAMTRNPLDIPRAEPAIALGRSVGGTNGPPAAAVARVGD